MYVYTFIMINHFPSVVWMHAMINVSTSQGRYSFVGNLNFHILAANQLCVFIHCTHRFAADWHQTNKELWKYTKTVWLNSECQTLTRCKFCVFHFALLMNIALHRSLRCHTFKKFSITVFFLYIKDSYAFSATWIYTTQFVDGLWKVVDSKSCACAIYCTSVCRRLHYVGLRANTLQWNSLTRL